MKRDEYFFKKEVVEKKYGGDIYKIFMRLKRVDRLELLLWGGMVVLPLLSGFNSIIKNNLLGLLIVGVILSIILRWEEFRLWKKYKSLIKGEDYVLGLISHIRISKEYEVELFPKINYFVGEMVFVGNHEYMIKKIFERNEEIWAELENGNHIRQVSYDKIKGCWVSEYKPRLKMLKNVYRIIRKGE